MGFRFWRRIKLASGVTLNLSKSGGSLSFGPRGAKFTLSPHGNRATAGIPGTGMFYTKKTSPKKSGKRKSRRSPSPDSPAVSPKDRLTLGFFETLFASEDEKAFVAGCRELVAGNQRAALAHLKKATHLPDGAFLAGFLALHQHKLDLAENGLRKVLKQPRGLGRYFSKYGMAAYMSLPITEEVTAHVGPDVRGALLGLVEIYQLQKNREEALSCLNHLRRLEPHDPVVKLSLVELVLEANPRDRQTCQNVVRLTGEIENDSEIHAALLLYKGRALKELGLYTAARDTLTAAFRRKKDRSEELLRAVQYERALVYEKLNRQSRAREEFEKIYAEAPDYEDVSGRLGLE